MNRRELLKPLAAIVATPLLIKGEVVGRAIPIDSNKRYIVFVNADLIDASDLCESMSGPQCPFTQPTAVYPVLVPRDMSLDDAIRIYEVPA